MVAVLYIIRGDIPLGPLTGFLISGDGKTVVLRCNPVDPPLKLDDHANGTGQLVHAIVSHGYSYAIHFEL